MNYDARLRPVATNSDIGQAAASRADTAGVIAPTPLIYLGAGARPAAGRDRGHGVIAREECYLERKFGARYTDYKRRVRRWI